MSRTQRARRGLELWTLCAALAGFSACDEAQHEPQQSTDSVLSLSQSLESAVASCAENARSCEADAGASNSCRDDFATCRDAATESAKAGMEAAVSACAEQAKTCRDAASSDDAKAACRDQLRACVGDEKPDGGGGDAAQPDKPDAGGKSPVASCISALHTCLEGDQKARVCTEALQQCIADSVGHNGQGTPPDHDAGKPGNDRDAESSKPDAAQDKPDAGQGNGKPEEQPDAAQGGGKPEDKPDAAQGGGKPDDAGMPADAGMGDSKECKDAREACLANGEDKDACARMQRTCRDR